MLAAPAVDRFDYFLELGPGVYEFVNGAGRNTRLDLFVNEAALFGLVHFALALTVLVPLLPGVHPRMASERAGPESTAMLEPPGLLSLNYGTATPLVALCAHLAYGAVLGLLLSSG
mgnify:CR=1 FL=1